MRSKDIEKESITCRNIFKLLNEFSDDTFAHVAPLMFSNIETEAVKEVIKQQKRT